MGRSGFRPQQLCLSLAAACGLLRSHSLQQMSLSRFSLLNKGRAALTPHSKREDVILHQRGRRKRRRRAIFSGVQPRAGRQAGMQDIGSPVASHLQTQDIRQHALSLSFSPSLISKELLK